MQVNGFYFVMLTALEIPFKNTAVTSGGVNFLASDDIGLDKIRKDFDLWAQPFDLTKDLKVCYENSECALNQILIPDYEPIQ